MGWENWLGDGARAVGDGEGGGLNVSVSKICIPKVFIFLAHLSHGVCLAAVDDLSGAGAVGGVLSHDLGGIGGIAPGLSAGHEGDRCDD